MASDDIVINLKILSMVKENQKLCVNNGTLTVETDNKSLLVSLKRWMNGHNRTNTMNFLKNLVSTSISLNDQKLIEPLKEALLGLNALAITYANDTVVVATIRVLEKKIKEFVQIDNKEDG